MRQVNKITRNCINIQADIDENKERIKALQTLGDKACSDYDLLMGYNAHFYLNVWKVHSWRIEKLNTELEKVKKVEIQLDLFQ